MVRHRFASVAILALLELCSLGCSQKATSKDASEFLNICLTKPQDALHSKEEIQDLRSLAARVSTNDLRQIILCLDKSKKADMDLLIDKLYKQKDLNLESLDGPTQKLLGERFNMTASGLSESSVIYSQLLSREILALEVWKPGMSSEECLAQADKALASH